jgi:hypothetical protein
LSLLLSFQAPRSNSYHNLNTHAYFVMCKKVLYTRSSCQFTKL